MKYQISFGKFVMVVLGCYLAFVIFKANSKLRSKKIGTIFSTVGQKTVKYPAFTVCTARETDEDNLSGEIKSYPLAPRDDLIKRHIYQFKKYNR